MHYSGTKPELAKKLLSVLSEKRAGRGAAIGVAIILDGELIAAFTDGVRGLDSSPAGIDDLYNVGSVSKVYCAAAVMKLAEMGMVDPDVPVTRYLPRFKMKDKRYRDITLRMTLNHSSGMPGTNYHNAIADFWNGENIMEENYAYWEHAKLKAPPGEYSVYCNDGFEVAAAVVEEVSGRRYIDFLRDQILLPAGIESAGQAEVAIGDRRMMSCLGRRPEWLTALGAGAIRTDVTDCARFGYLFVEPREVMGKAFFDEIVKPQGVTFLKNDLVTPNYGLGWDSVRFSDPALTLGGTVLAKGGGTGQFLSYLIVSPEFRLSAAISGTVDCRTDNPRLLCELTALALKGSGIDVPAVSPKPLRREAKPLPAGWGEQYCGVYYSALGVFRVETEGDELFVKRYAGGGRWTDLPILPPMKWKGERFFSPVNSAVFESHNGIDYLISRIRPDREEYVTLAQKNTAYHPLHSGWSNRAGEKYIICNLAAYDIVGARSPGIIIDTFSDDGVILFVFPPNPFMPPFPFNMGDYNVLPAVSSGDSETEMFLNAPGDGSRNIYAPEVFEKDGKEYLRYSGFVYINAASVSGLETGPVISPQGQRNAVYRVRKGTKLVFKKPADVTVYVLDEGLSPVYSSMMMKDMPPVCDGYIIFANTNSMEFNVEVRHC